MCLRVCVSMSSCVTVSVGISYEVNLNPRILSTTSAFV